ncbi:MAG: TIGR03842 family LLM class F420-dependent oxidoreductase [Nitrososphaerota archaeon]|nr:TIGR03842 family LLM class F420-dependent oxidoreductase [Nitrososphaerota archaeon]
MVPGPRHKFGVIYNAREPYGTLKAVQLIDRAGFDVAGTYDSHFIWEEPWVFFSMWATNTKQIRMGPFVTNPLTRHITVTASLAATLSSVTKDGRVFLGLGRGDSSVRTMGKKPASLETLEASVKILKSLTSGGKAEIDGTEVSLPWAKYDVPVYVAAYGPKALELAGRVGDGVILQIADADVIRWSMEHVKKGAESVGRDLNGFEVISASAWYISRDIEKARKEIRWFPAMVSNHAVDLLRKYPPEELPHSLIEGMEKRGGYDYWEHARPDAHHLGFVTDDMIDRFSVIGTPEAAVSRLEELWKAGVTNATAYVLSPDYQRQSEIIADHIVAKYR